MDIRQLNALLAVADFGTFSAAADALNTVQSNVSAHIARLEKELGVVLINRVGNQLTQEGEAVIRRARRIQSELDAVSADVAALRNEVIGEVRVGLIGTTARWLIPEVLSVMGERHPHAHLRISEGTTTTVLEPQLIAGSLDLAVVLLPMQSSEVVTQPLFEEDMLLVVEKDNPLAGEDEIELAALADTPLLLPPTGTAQRAELEGAALNAGSTLKAKTEVDGVRLTTSLVFDGHGPSILPATALPNALGDGWKIVKVTGLPPRRVGLANLRRSFPSAPTKALREVLGEVVQKSAAKRPGVHLLKAQK